MARKRTKKMAKEKSNTIDIDARKSATGLKSPVIDHIREMYSTSGISHTFLVFGNVHDLQPVKTNQAKSERYYMRLPMLLGKYFEKIFDLVATYDRHSWSFLSYPANDGVAKAKHIMESTSPVSEEGPRRYGNVSQPQNRPALDLASVFGDTSGSSGPLKISDDGALADAEKLMLQAEQPLVLVFDFAEAYLAAGPWGNKREVDALVSRILRWAGSREIRSKQHLIIILTTDYSALHPALKEPDNGIEKIQVNYPLVKDREEFISFWISMSDVEKTEEENTNQIIPKNSAAELARATAGLNYSAIEDILVKATMTGSLDYNYVRQRKDLIIKHSYNDVIEVPTPERGWEFVAGIDYIKDYLMNSLVKPLREGDVENTPKGVLMCGPPGVGKSLAAEAVAKEANVTFVKLNLSKVFDKWVGSSERNMERALGLITSMTPCICFMDEMDQAGGDREGFDGTGGTQKRVFRSLLELMGDDAYKGKVVFLAATNRPDLMDSAMKRAGRFDRKLAFLPPNKAARKALFNTFARKYSIEGLIVTVDALNQTHDWVPVDIEALVVKSREMIRLGKATSKTALTLALKFIRPSIKPSVVKQMTELALSEINDLSTLPDYFIESSEYATLTAPEIN